MSSSGEPGVGDGREAGVDRQRQRVDHQAPADAATGRCPRAPTVCSNRSVAERRARRRALRFGHRGRRRPARRSARTAAATRPRAARSGPRRAWPMCTSSGSQPTMLVVRRTLGSSSSATLAMTYGGSNAGQPLVVVHGEADRPWPGPTPRCRSRGCGCGTPGRSARAGGRGRRSRRSPGCAGCPSAPEVQNHSLTGVSWGSGPHVGQKVLRRNPTASPAVREGAAHAGGEVPEVGDERDAGDHRRRHRSRGTRGGRPARAAWTPRARPPRGSRRRRTATSRRWRGPAGCSVGPGRMALIRMPCFRKPIASRAM